MGSQNRLASLWVVKDIHPLPQLLPKCEVHSFPLCKKTKTSSTWAPAKSSPRLPLECENGFIVILLPGPLSADTTNRALSIWYWLVLIHYLGLFCIPTPPLAELHSLVPDGPHQTSKAPQSSRKYSSCLLVTSGLAKLFPSLIFPLIPQQCQPCNVT